MATGAAFEDKKPSDTDDAPFAQKEKQSRHFAVIGKGMRQNNALLAPLLNADIMRWYPWSGILPRSKAAPDAFIGWGQKKSKQRADKAARRQNIEAIGLEDGFLRSLDSGIHSRYGLSMVIDDVGIYFDLTQPSHLERLITQRINYHSASDDAIAKQLITKICKAQLSKYNAVTDCPSLDKLATNDSENPDNNLDNVALDHVLLIDQVQGDASIKGAGANKRQFKKMLRTAMKNHPNAHIWIKAHPASDNGYLTALTLPKNVRVLKQALNPIALLNQVDHVYTVSSHMGFEALMLGKSVYCFGVNWYSGWGLTEDSGAPKRLLNVVKKRRQETSATLEMLFYSAYIEYSRYADPATGQSCDIDTAIEWLITNREWQQKLAGDLTIFEFSRWKLPFVKAFVDFPRTTLFIKPKPRLKNLLHPDHFRVDYDKPLLVWGLGKRQQLISKFAKLSRMTPPIYCMEDGFIRSNGLGATLLAPLSVVIDQRGIYYDATHPSDLEVMLHECPALTLEQLERVQHLQHRLLTQRVSKYNVGNSKNNSAPWLQAVQTTSKRRLLIVGQVEDDLSVKYCGSLIKTNSGLIERVRHDHPDAYLIYKPHPDVEAGLRAGKVSDKQLTQVDAIAHDMAMPDCLSLVDEVHTISSLTGFEALLRDLTVVCYGLPFYAGWGLTTDIDADLAPKAEYLQRRFRQTPLTLAQLLHCTLIDYPLYRLPDGYGLAQVEQVIDYLYPALPKVGESQNQSTIQKPPTAKVSSQLKRHAATRFMQQRHQLLERLSKRSRQ